MIKEINDNKFNEEVVNSDVPVVVDFWATWCGPCRMLAPVMEDISNELDGKAKFVKINVDENPVTSSQFRVASIPTLLIFNKGKVAETLVGFRPKESIVPVIKKYI